MTMMSGVITFRNMLRRKSSQPSVPSDQQDRDQRRRRRDDHERDAAEEQDGDQAAGDEADGVVDEPVALDGVADLELHDRHAGKLAAAAPVPARSSSIVLRISPTTSLRPLLSTTAGSSASTISASVPSSESSLPRMISLVSTRSMSVVVRGALAAARPGRAASGSRAALAAAGAPRTAR